jgi:hypothetical protein
LGERELLYSLSALPLLHTHTGHECNYLSAAAGFRSGKIIMLIAYNPFHPFIFSVHFQGKARQSTGDDGKEERQLDATITV